MTVTSLELIVAALVMISDGDMEETNEVWRPDYHMFKLRKCQFTITDDITFSYHVFGYCL